MISKKYKTSNSIRVFTLGLKRYGFKIESEVLVILGLSPKHIPIDSIDKITFESRIVVDSLASYYSIVNKQGKEYQLSNETIDRDTYQEMFKDVLSINPKIRLNQEMDILLTSKLSKKNLKLDFTVNTKDYFKRDHELSINHPSLNTLMAITMLLISFALPLLFNYGGNHLLTLVHGSEYEIYRIFNVTISGIALAVALCNLFISLVSMYLGHKLTITFLIIFITGLIIGFV